MSNKQQIKIANDVIRGALRTVLNIYDGASMS